VISEKKMFSPPPWWWRRFSASTKISGKTTPIDNPR
jgi:hypothetical protein